MSATPGAAPPFPRIAGLYGILDPSAVPEGNGGREATVDRALDGALSGGCRVIQYRDKAAPSGLLLARAKRLSRACRAAGALFLVNDRLDVALLSEADGCHLGQDDLPVSAARRIVPAGFLLGVSTHGAPEAKRAQEEGADYVGVGAIFRTTSKSDARKPRGPRLVAEVAAAVSIPAVAIGGITRHNVRDVIRAGASAAAVISDLFGAPDVRERAAEFLRIWDEERRRR